MSTATWAVSTSSGHGPRATRRGSSYETGALNHEPLVGSASPIARFGVVGHGSSPSDSSRRTSARSCGRLQRVEVRRLGHRCAVGRLIASASPERSRDASLFQLNANRSAIGRCRAASTAAGCASGSRTPSASDARSRRDWSSCRIHGCRVQRAADRSHANRALMPQARAHRARRPDPARPAPSSTGAEMSRQHLLRADDIG